MLRKDVIDFARRKSQAITVHSRIKAVAHPIPDAKSSQQFGFEAMLKQSGSIAENPRKTFY